MIKAKFLTNAGVPLHPIVAHNTDPDGKEYVKAVLNQGVFEEAGRPCPPLTVEKDGQTVENEERYLHIRLSPVDYDALPEGQYSISEEGRITDIDAPHVDPQRFVSSGAAAKDGD